METIEAGVVVGQNYEALWWHLPPGRSVGHLPGSRELWDVLWSEYLTGRLYGFAHSHPGTGIPLPSPTDLTTFMNVEAALGQTLSWWIVNQDHVVLIRRNTVDSVFEKHVVAKPAPWLRWVDQLRSYSTVESKEPKEKEEIP